MAAKPFLQPHQRPTLSTANSRSNTWGAASPLASAAAAPAAIAPVEARLVRGRKRPKRPGWPPSPPPAAAVPPAHPRAAAHPGCCPALHIPRSNVHLLTLKDTGSSYLVRLAHLYQVSKGAVGARVSQGGSAGGLLFRATPPMLSPTSRSAPHAVSNQLPDPCPNASMLRRWARTLRWPSL